MNHSINDSFMNPDRFGYAVIPYYQIHSDTSQLAMGGLSMS